MTASIGIVGCDFLKGMVPNPKRRVKVWNRDGIAGVAAQDLGLGDAEFKLTAIYSNSTAAVQSWAAALYLLQGTVVILQDDWGTSHSNCLITKVAPVVITPYMDPTTATIKARGECEIVGEKRS